MTSRTGAVHLICAMAERDNAKNHATLRLESFLAEVDKRAFHIARLAVTDREEALDIVQDVMLAFANRYAKKPEEQWRPLFYRCLDNRIKDWFRRQSTRGRWLAWLDQPDEPPVAQRFPDQATPTPGEQLGLDHFGDALEKALSMLPHRQRQAFLLRTWEGMNVAETAKAMGCSAGSVKTHLSRAMGALRERLAEHQHER